MVNVASQAPLGANKTLQTLTGVKDTFLQFFLTKVEDSERLARPGAEEQANREAFSTLPRNPFSPVWRLRGKC